MFINYFVPDTSNRFVKSFVADMNEISKFLENLKETAEEKGAFFEEYKAHRKNLWWAEAEYMAQYILGDQATLQELNEYPRWVLESLEIAAAAIFYEEKKDISGIHRY